MAQLALEGSQSFPVSVHVAPVIAARGHGRARAGGATPASPAGAVHRSRRCSGSFGIRRRRSARGNTTADGLEWVRKRCGKRPGRCEITAAAARETESDQVMCGIADHGLIKVADFDFELAVGVGNGAKIANMTVSADPNFGPLWDRGGTFFEPFVKFGRGNRAHSLTQTAPFSGSAASLKPDHAGGANSGIRNFEHEVLQRRRRNVIRPAKRSELLQLSPVRAGRRNAD